jgi:hypothetical protein
MVAALRVGCHDLAGHAYKAWPPAGRDTAATGEDSVTEATLMECSSSTALLEFLS